MANVCALTTFDNPWNPFTNFVKWMNFDNERGYNTMNKLAREANVSEQMNDVEYNFEVERAVDHIIATDPLCCYKKVQKES